MQAQELRLLAVAEPTDRRPMLELLSQGRARMSVIIWFALSAAYAVVFLLSYWLPTLLMGGGASIKAAGLIIATAKVGGITADLVIGRLMDRFGPTRILALSFAIAAAVVALLGHASGQGGFAAVLVMLTFFFVDASFSGAQALAASSYPPAMRAGASGWITGWARFIGGGAGTLAGGYVIGSHWPLDRTALAFALPLLLGAAALSHLAKLEREMTLPGEDNSVVPR